MTTLTIEVPDSESSVITAITEITTNAGLKVIIENDDDALSETEFESLKKGLEEAVLIKKGLSKSIPSSELWND
jgi:hypothetical protein